MRDGLRDILGKECVRDTADLGDSFPDLVCGWRGRTFLLEVKAPDGDERPGQTDARTSWRGGPWVVVHSLAEACAALGIG